MSIVVVDWSDEYLQTAQVASLRCAELSSAELLVQSSTLFPTVIDKSDAAGVAVKRGESRRRSGNGSKKGKKADGEEEEWTLHDRRSKVLYLG